MSNAWEKAKKLAEKSGDSDDLYIQLKENGDLTVGVFCGEPDIQEVHWTQQGKRVCTGASCPHCASERPKVRIKSNFFELATGRMRIVEGNYKFMLTLLEVRETCGLDKWVFEIKRHGAAGDTQTTYTILPKAPLDDALRARVISTPLNNFGPATNTANAAKPPTAPSAPPPSAAQPPPPAPPPQTTGEMMDPKYVTEIIARLKSMPRAEANKFLTAFGVTKVREIPSSRTAEVQAYFAEEDFSFE